jgi:hypothetical protein
MKNIILAGLMALSLFAATDVKAAVREDGLTLEVKLDKSTVMLSNGLTSFEPVQVQLTVQNHTGHRVSFGTRKKYGFRIQSIPFGGSSYINAYGELKSISTYSGPIVLQPYSGTVVAMGSIPANIIHWVNEYYHKELINPQIPAGNYIVEVQVPPYFDYRTDSGLSPDPDGLSAGTVPGEGLPGALLTIVSAVSVKTPNKKDK